MTTTRARLSAIITVSALLLSACSSSSSDGASDSGGSGSSSGVEFTAQTLDGAEITAASFEGKDTVLWFWAPWCTTCRAEAPHVSATAAEFDDQVEVLGVAGRGDVSEMEGFVSDTGTEAITHIVDESGEIWSDYEVTSQPAFAFINDDGAVDVVVGALGEDEFQSRVEALATA